MSDEHGPRLVAGYHALADKIKSRIAEAGEHLSLHELLETARSAASELQEFSRDEFDRISYYIKRDLAEKKRWLYLSVQGGGNEQTPQGPGHSWSTPDTEKVLALTRWTLANRPADPEKVVLIGFSAGGTMVLRIWKKDPKLFAGIITCSSPATPDSGHDAARIAVFLGTDDPNYGGAASVRSRFEKRKVGGTLQVVSGSGHNDLPDSLYFGLVLDWMLEKKTAGHEVRLPKTPPAAPDSPYRHVLVAYSKAKGAPKSLRRKKSSAKSLAKRILKAVEGGRAYLPHEAQAQSDDRESAPVGGAITLERLKAYGGDVEEVEAALEKAKKGVAGPLESDAGFHLVMKVGEE